LDWVVVISSKFLVLDYGCKENEEEAGHNELCPLRKSYIDIILIEQLS
jgi:hypothetical protein